jgi:uncharacterized membrane protein YfcA
MPRRDTHVTVGVAAGAVWAYYHARNEHPVDQAVEVLGGAIGGWFGGLLPDVLDPPTTPRHRDMAHGLVLLLLVAFASLEAERRACRTRAESCSTAGNAAADLRPLVWRFIAGVLTGLQAGYVSHLVLDGNTKAALPLLVRGF